MAIMHITKLALIAVLVSACAGAATRDRPTTTAASGPEEREVCEVTRVTGTNVTRTVCRTEYESTLDRNGAKEWMRNGTSASGIDPADGQFKSFKPKGAATHRW